jgi:hypothetical protein
MTAGLCIPATGCAPDAHGQVLQAVWSLQGCSNFSIRGAVAPQGTGLVGRQGATEQMPPCLAPAPQHQRSRAEADSWLSPRRHPDASQLCTAKLSVSNFTSATTSRRPGPNPSSGLLTYSRQQAATARKPAWVVAALKAKLTGKGDSGRS